LGLTEWGFERTLGKGGVCLVAIPDLFWGNESRIRFWDDVWCGEMPLKEAFPSLYDIDCDKNSLVAVHLILESGSFQCDVKFIRETHDWEVDVLASFPLRSIWRIKILESGLFHLDSSAREDPHFG
jgi:hypothetical protein